MCEIINVLKSGISCKIKYLSIIDFDKLYFSAESSIDFGPFKDSLTCINIPSINLSTNAEFDKLIKMLILNIKIKIEIFTQKIFCFFKYNTKNELTNT